MNSFILYGHFLKVYMKIQLEFRFSFIGDIFVNMFTFITVYLSFWVMFNTFDNLNGWTYWQLIFLFNINLFTYSFSSLFFWAPMKYLEQTIKNGDFDNFLTKPMSPFKLLIFRQFQHTFLGHIIISIFVFFLCLNHLHINWNINSVFFLLYSLAGGVLIQSSIIILAGSSAFWIFKSSSFVDLFTSSVRNFANYPISIFGKTVQLILTFLIPYALVNYYPVTYLIGNNNNSYSYPIISFLTFPVGVILFLLSLWGFKRGLVRYEGAGT
ncbi:ABC-2 family transporter protein [Paenibacillus sp. ClWae2A]|uniref:ABC transporter permease n=1 Tax=Paenibacillus sp. ClWae2A TaxID=3057177 RepID=UPI0028F6A163|nr:ABC-2 family transporter protein [Paenibacillus sp. ClWae2A]MDT9722439.1 ABC-2 family transporter protein [Paenibacillus sp. ClWae2A]